MVDGSSSKEERKKEILRMKWEIPGGPKKKKRNVNLTAPISKFNFANPPFHYKRCTLGPRQ